MNEKPSGGRIKKILITVIISMILLSVFLFVFQVGSYQATKDAAPITELDNYRNEKFAGWLFYDPYAVFPNEEIISRANDCNYLYKRVISAFPLMYDNDIVAFLECNFQTQAYLEEKDRLLQLCGDINEEQFSLPAYVYAIRGGGFYQHALVNDTDCTIFYISFQHRFFTEEYIDLALLPIK